MRINQPVFRTKGLSPNTSYTVNQLLKDGTVLKNETVVADENGTIEFKHVRNCEEVEVLNGETVVASLECRNLNIRTALPLHLLLCHIKFIKEMK